MCISSFSHFSFDSKPTRLGAPLCKAPVKRCKRNVKAAQTMEQLVGLALRNVSIFERKRLAMKHHCKIPGYVAEQGIPKMKEVLSTI